MPRPLLIPNINALQVQPEALTALNLGPATVTPSRTNGFLSMFETMRKRTLMLTQQLPRFPSMLISADGIEPQGSFAESQAQYLEPDKAEVDRLVQVRHQLLFRVIAETLWSLWSALASWHTIQAIQLCKSLAVLSST